MLPAPTIIEIENRTYKRKQCHWSAVLLTDGFHRSCMIEDIGNGGCRLLINTGHIDPGMPIKINVPDRKLTFTGTVVWAHCEEAGIRFTSKPARLREL